jgi:glyoxylase-like metal-dependent hydrolase (beta-lactamase superfamily II)
MMRTTVAAAICLASSIAASSIAHAQDAAGVLRKASVAMGADNLNTLRYAASGTGASFGQAFKPDTAWPKLNVANFVRQIDYQAPAIMEDVMRSRGEKQGGGAAPIGGEARAVTVAHGRFAWNVAGPLAIPRQEGLDSRLHDLWTTPHGAIKAASRGGAKLDFVKRNGREVAAVSFGEKGVYSATAFLDDGFLVERVESRYTDNVMGDIAVVTTYSNYRIFGPIVFPTRIRQTMAGSPTLDLNVSDVQPNAKVDISVPEVVAKASGEERVVSEKAAEGVWFIAGGSHNSAAIEMKDHVILVESPLGDGRAMAVINEVRKLVPNKPLRYVISSHHHFDHAGGLRAAVAEGMTVVAQAQSKGWYEKTLSAPARINPDRLAKSGKKARFMPVNEKLVLDDGSRKVEIHRLVPSDHTDTFLMVYLPKEKLLIQADAFTPGPPNAAPPAAPNNYNQLTLVENIERLKLQVDRHLPLHGRMVPNVELYRAAGKPIL